MSLRVLIVSLGSTVGLRSSDAELAASLGRAGADVRVARATAPRSVRTLALTDLVWARAARAAALEAIASDARPRDRLLDDHRRPARARTAGRSASTRCRPTTGPGRHGIWQRPRERTVLARAPLLLPTSEGALDRSAAAAPAGDRRADPRRGVRAAAARSPRATSRRRLRRQPGQEGSRPRARGVGAVRREGEELVLTGVPDAPAIDGVRVAGTLERSDYRALLRRARIYIAAPRREEYGIAQLEALADGAMLVSTEPRSPTPRCRSRARPTRG